MFFKRVALLGLVLGGAWACQPSAPPEELVAKVDGDGITKREFEQQVEHNLARYRGQTRELPPGIEERIKESVLKRLIDDKVIAQKAKSMGIIVSDEEVNAKLDEHKKRFRTDEAFKAYLERSKNTEDNIRNDLQRNMLRDRVVEKLSGTIEVSDEDIAAYYQDNQARFMQKEQVRANRILIRGEQDDAKKKDQEARRSATQLRARATKGEDFAALAKDNSQGPEASRGGDLGWFSRGRFPPEFDAAVFKLKEGDVSDVIHTKLGYEIVKVVEKREERQRPLDEVQTNIKNSLEARERNKKRRDVLRQLKAEAKVEQLIQFDKPQAAQAPNIAPPTASPIKMPQQAAAKSDEKKIPEEGNSATAQ